MEDTGFSLFLQSAIVIVTFVLAAALLGWLLEPKAKQHTLILPIVCVLNQGA